MSTEENKKLIERLYDEGLNRHDAPAAAAFYAADALNHGQRVGRAGMQAVFEALFNTFPDFRYQVEESTAEADRVVCKVTMTGTHLGPLATIPATGKTMKIGGTIITRFADDLWAEDFVYYDFFGLLQQLGVVPAMA